MNRFILILTLLTFSCVGVDINEEYADGIDNYKQGEFEIAIEKLSKVIHATDTCYDCLYYRRDAYRHLSDYEKAKIDFSKLLATSESVNKCLGYMNRGSVYYDELRYIDALENYKEGLRFCTDSGTVMNMISHMYFAINKKDSGCVFYQKSLKVKETDWNPEIPKYCNER